MFCRRMQAAQSISQDLRPLVGYIDYLQIDSSRRKRLTPHPHPDKKRTNDVCQRISDIKVARATPQEWTEDPYLLCILISIAQFQEHTQEGSQMASQKVCALVELAFLYCCDFANSCTLVTPTCDSWTG